MFVPTNLAYYKFLRTSFTMPIQKISYAKGHQKSLSADQAVKKHGDGLESRGAYEAHIRSAPT